jgi:hypothetical protein
MYYCSRCIYFGPIWYDIFTGALPYVIGEPSHRPQSVFDSRSFSCMFRHPIGLTKLECISSDTVILGKHVFVVGQYDEASAVS